MVHSKGEFNQLSRAGRLGNFLRSWDSIYEVRDAEYSGYLTIRNQKPGSPHFIPVTQTCCLVSHVAVLESRGARAEDLYFQEIPSPDARRVANIEAMLTETGVALYYERDTTSPVRGIRERGTYADGLRAQVFLRTVLSPESYDTLQEIWREHPTSVIEATEWSDPCGSFHQTLTVWEVRDF